jgi:hypothetical protein
MLQEDNFKVLSKASDQFKALFLLRIVKEMIRNSETEDLDKLGSIIKKKRNEKRKSSDGYFKEKYPEHIPSIMYRHQEARQAIRPPPTPTFQEFSMPETNPYMPAPQQRNIQLNLGRLNNLIRDPNVTSIECPGPEENITIRGPRGTRVINLFLSKDEVHQILQIFSQVSKIPIEEGVVRIMVGRLSLSAVVSDVLGSRFIIKKAMQQPQSQFMRRY